ncbi:hypothetical protein Btus_2006 [Kyrpidia tusciae DSM 2912]|uniref:Uncharacterized protein n=1 Tax=Kyrpidia tusciae (strain DSM 2912 / NBRC 15312 / T2) TaxID=562970 RepID=D5WQT7_KYRT2|nr:hypothetical protein Btus_2006 [Kyrpidia tusciae DSM 2912]
MFVSLHIRSSYCQNLLIIGVNLQNVEGMAHSSVVNYQGSDGDDEVIPAAGNYRVNPGRKLVVPQVGDHQHGLEANHRPRPGFPVLL